MFRLHSKLIFISGSPGPKNCPKPLIKGTNKLNNFLSAIIMKQKLPPLYIIWLFKFSKKNSLTLNRYSVKFVVFSVLRSLVITSKPFKISIWFLLFLRSEFRKKMNCKSQAVLKWEQKTPVKISSANIPRTGWGLNW